MCLRFGSNERKKYCSYKFYDDGFIFQMSVSETFTALIELKVLLTSKGGSKGGPLRLLLREAL